MSSWDDSDHTARPGDNAKPINVSDVLSSVLRAGTLSVTSHPAAKISSLHTRKPELGQTSKFT